jgi:hypothetical protein
MPRLPAVPIPPYSARTNDAAEQPAAGQLFVQRNDRLAQTRGVRIGDHEADVGGDGADIGDVIVDALQLEQNRPQPPRALRYFNPAGLLHRLAERRTMRKARVAGDALGEVDGAGDG